MPRRPLPQTYHSKIWRAIHEFDLLSPGDRVLVGFSGGKDSAFLLYALSVIKEYSPIPFEVAAITVDMGFQDVEFSPLRRFTESLGIEYEILKTNIADIVFSVGEDETPCAKCSYFRRGAINDYAVSHGFNKVAYAHHHDDAVETFLMSILYAGLIKTFQPKTHLGRTGVTVIRPLSYLRARDISKAFSTFLDYTPLPSPCPAADKSQRAKVRGLLKMLVRENRFVYTNLAAAMREGRPIELWPPAREVSPEGSSGPRSE